VRTSFTLTASGHIGTVTGITTLIGGLGATIPSPSAAATANGPIDLGAGNDTLTARPFVSSPTWHFILTVANVETLVGGPVTTPSPNHSRRPRRRQQPLTRQCRWHSDDRQRKTHRR
jgi:hypothetical protein